MKKEDVALQAKVYLYHLNNANKENGIKKGEGWKFSQVTDAGRLAIEHDYYPTVSHKVEHKVLQDFADNVMLYLKTNHPDIQVPDLSIPIEKDSEYLIAYSPARIRR